jgi:hypothetical protein
MRERSSVGTVPLSSLRLVLFKVEPAQATVAADLRLWLAQIVP